MNVMEDNKYVVRLTKDVIYYWQLLPWRVSIGNWEGRPLLLFCRGGGWGAAARTWYTWARLLATVRQMNPRSQKPDPRQWRKSNLDSTKKVECRNNQFFFIDAHPWPVICTSQRASSSPVRVASEASRKTTRERASERPHSALNTWSAVSVLSALWLLIPHMGSLFAGFVCTCCLPRKWH